MLKNLWNALEVIEANTLNIWTWKNNSKRECFSIDLLSIDNYILNFQIRFSDPTILLERYDFETLTPKSHQNEQTIGRAETAKSLAFKGNEWLRAKSPHTCCFCQKVFSHRFNLIQHLECVHIKTNKMFCDFCPKFFFAKFAILDHMKVHGSKNLTCNICDYKTFKNSLLESHKLMHAAKVECPICKKQVSSLKLHMKYHNPKQSCTVCRKLVHVFGLKQHMQIHSNKCKECKKNFDNIEALRRLVTCFMRNSLRKQTSICSHNLKEHYDGQLFECHCGSAFKLNSQLTAHQKTHIKKIETCRACRKQFASSHSLYNHWTRTHLKTHGELTSIKSEF